MLQAALPILQILHAKELRARDFCLWFLVTWYFSDKIMLIETLHPTVATFCSLVFAWTVLDFLKRDAQLEAVQMLDMIRLATTSPEAANI